MKTLKVLMIALLATAGFNTAHAQMSTKHVVVTKNHKHRVMRHHVTPPHHKP